MVKIKNPGKKNIEDILALTPMQEGMLFHYLKDTQSDHYFEQLSLGISGEINVDVFEKAWNAVIQANEMLRVFFRWEKAENPVQVVLKEYKLQPLYVDLSGSNSHQKRKQLEEIKRNDRREKFDLRNVPLRITLCKLEENKYDMIISYHHILYDGWSNGIILRELLNAYDDLVKGKIPLKPAKNKFKSYVKWLYSQDLNAAKQYWEKYLAGFDVKTGLPYKKKYKSEKGEIDTGHYRYTLAEPLKNKVEGFAAKNRATTASVFYLIWGILLQKYNRCEDIVFGTTVSGRSVKVKGIEDMVGLFINTLPLRLKTHPHETIIESLEDVDKNIKDREKYDNMSLAAVKGCAALDKRHELFDSIIIIENYPLDIHMMNNKNGFSITSYSIIEKTNYDLTIGITLSSDIRISVSYNTHCFDKPSIIKVSNTFAAVLEEVIRCPGKEVSSLEIVSTEEKEQILHEFNNTGADYPMGVTIHRLFAEQAERTPDGAAVVGLGPGAESGEQLQITYGELDKKSNRLAHHLRSKGVGPDTIVGIMVERSIEMIVGILGILKAGGAYLPIDPEYPEERINYMLKDSNARVLVSEESEVSKVSEGIMVVNPGELSEEHPNHLTHLTHPTHLCYVIYTSGSTGNPKGVVIEHRSVVNLLIDLNRRYPFGASDNYLLKTSYLFDVSVTELFGWFIGGGRLTVLEKGGEKDPYIIFREIEYRKVTHINFVPSMLHAFNDILAVENVTGLKYLRYIFLAGEALKPKLVGPLVKLHPHIQVENLYGPTEAAVYASQYSLSCWDGTGDIPIGKPVGNVKLYILNHYNQLQGMGIPGELCIGGVGLARGYLNKPGLTQDRFVDNPFVPGERLYKTGDLANWLPDGNIEFLGRLDQQVKIRGFRIELGEIESLLLRHEKVKEAVVIDRETGRGDKYLCAYIVLGGSGSVEEGDYILGLREYLFGKLPDYMVPWHIVEIEKIPLTVSGKINRKALPEPEIRRVETHIGPRSRVEERLVEIWAKVLGLERDVISIDSNFFELGGHSIKAIVLVSRIHKELEVKLPLTEVFKRRSIRGLAGYIEESRKSKYIGIKPVEEKEYYELSSAQKRLYFLNRMDVESINYNMSIVVPLGREIEINRLETTLKKLIARHESLRTSFERVNELPVQRIHAPGEIEFAGEFYQVEVEDEVKVAEIINNFIRPFDLSQAPLIRSGMIRCVDRNYIWMLDVHHIVSDGTSNVILTREFMLLYNGEELERLRLQYKDFSRWQNRLFERGVIKAQEEYWLGLYADIEEIPRLDLAADYRRPEVFTFAGDHYSFELEKEDALAFKGLAIENGGTLYMNILAVLNTLFYKYTGQRDIIIGSVTAGRPHADLQHIIGMFVNTLAMRNYPEGEKRYQVFLKEVISSSVEVFENQDVQFEELVERLEPERDLSRNPLFDITMVVQSVEGIGEGAELPVVEGENQYTNKISKFDMTFFIVEQEDGISVSIEYYTSIFKEETILRLASHFKNVIKAVVTDPHIKLKDIEVMSEQERQQVVYAFNDTAGDYPKDKTIAQLFEEQAARTSESTAIVGSWQGAVPPTDKVAVGDGERTGKTAQLTYGELNQKANQLAYMLRKKGVLADHIVAIMMERSIEMIIGILGILKAGGAYLPIDPEYPQERIDFMLKDSNARILVSKLSEVSKVSEGTDIVKPGELREGHPTHLCYAIYTSGTSGKPKGVLLNHINLVNYVSWFSKETGLSSLDRTMLTSSFAFDLGYTSIFTSILNGGELHLVGKELYLSADGVINYIEREQITYLKVTPSLFSIVVHSPYFSRKSLRTLRLIVMGGEEIKLADVERANSLYNRLQIMNHYGPTEATIGTVAQFIDFNHFEEYKNHPAIGMPIHNMKAFILDGCLKLQPVGVPGELYIGGTGVARGYLNNVERTREKFLDNPFVPGEIMYRSGDCGTWLAGGNIEFLGRLDSQVKIRGYRIELGEIEDRLLKFEKIKDAVVVSKKDKTNHNYLCAYIVMRDSQDDKSAPASSIDFSEVKKELLENLPDYMLPSYFVTLKKLPLTKNGKVDRRNLPPPEETTLRTRVEYAAPGNTIEKKLVEIWENVLGRKPIGIHDNFFEIGGDSIKSIQIASRMDKAGYKLQMKDIFRDQTISKLAAGLRKIEKISHQAIVYGTVPLSPIQHWFFENKFPDSHHYNQSVMFYSQERFEEEAVKAVFLKIQEHHDALRMTYKEENGEIIQTNHGLDYPVSLQVYDFRNQADKKKVKEALEEKANEIQSSIDMEKGPLMKLGLFHLDDGDRLLIVIHHLVIDGVSWRILFEDFETLYRQYKKGMKLELPLKTNSYKLWSEALSGYANSESFLKEKAYWVELESQTLEPIKKDFEEGCNYAKDRETLSFQLSEEETTYLLTKVNEFFGTEINDILLTALGLGLKRNWGHNRFLIALEGHGREEILTNVDIKRTVGWFTCIYPFILDMSCENDLYRQVKEVKNNLRQLPEKGIGYGILRYLTAKENRRELDFKLIPQVVFNYLGQFDEELKQTSLEIAKESAGNTRNINAQRAFELEISGIIKNKKLEISIAFNRAQYKTGTIESLLNYYKRELRHLISYCSARNERKLISCDLTDDSLSIDALDEIIDNSGGEIEDIYRLSSIQQGILFHVLYDRLLSVYFSQISYIIKGRLNIAFVERSLNELFKRYDMLRTNFIYEGLDVPLQKVLKEGLADFFYEDISRIEFGSRNEKENYIKEFKKMDRQRSFDLGKDPLLRLAVIRMDKEEYQFVWSFHHILMDGWSTGILNADFFEIYNSLLENRTNNLSPVTPFRTYIEWLEKCDRESSRIYWQKYLEGYKKQAVVPKMEKFHTNEPDYKHEEAVFFLGKEQSDRLNRLAGHNHVTLNTILQTVWGIILGKYNCTQDVVFGTVVSGRPQGIVGVESMVGLFINSVPVRITFEETMKFNELLRIVQERAIDSEPHHYYPLWEIQSQSVLKQNLIDHEVVFENYPVVKQMEGMFAANDRYGKGARLELSDVNIFEQSNYDFGAAFCPGEQLSVKFIYNGNVYEKNFINRIALHIREVIDIVTSNDISIDDIKISHDLSIGKSNFSEEEHISFEF